MEGAPRIKLEIPEFLEEEDEFDSLASPPLAEQGLAGMPPISPTHHQAPSLQPVQAIRGLMTRGPRRAILVTRTVDVFTMPQEGTLVPRLGLSRPTGARLLELQWFLAGKLDRRRRANHHVSHCEVAYCESLGGDDWCCLGCAEATSPLWVLRRQHNCGLTTSLATPACPKCRANPHLVLPATQCRECSFTLFLLNREIQEGNVCSIWGAQ